MFEPGKLKDLVSKPDVHEPFSLGSLIAWLRTKPAHEKYDLCDWAYGCLWSKYTIENGGSVDGVLNFYVLNNAALSVSPDYDAGKWRWDIAADHPHTMGAALSRALAEQASV